MAYPVSWCERCRRSFRCANKRIGVCPYCLHDAGIDVLVCSCDRCRAERDERDLSVVQPELPVDPAGEGI